jgi:hypothetical protein
MQRRANAIETYEAKHCPVNEAAHGTTVVIT